MVLRPHDGGPLRDSALLRRSVGGAEANVAGALAELGVPSTWVSRLGRDPFGEYVADDLTSRGVRVLAEHDEARPTGVYLKDSPAAGNRMYYYRSGAAAAAMNAELLADPHIAAELSGCELVHTTGITAGILADDSGLLAALARLRDRTGFTLSVDLNWRPALWQGRDRAALLDLLRTADLLLLGSDEAAAALGTHDPDKLRGLLGPRPRLVLKSDSHAATEHDPDGRVTEVPALSVDVVEPIGAGDGFAAGYLSALLAGLGPIGRLRIGHLVAASVLASPGDHATALPSSTVLRGVAGASAESWSATRVTPAGPVSPALEAHEEVG